MMLQTTASSPRPAAAPTARPPRCGTRSSCTARPAEVDGACELTVCGSLARVIDRGAVAACRRATSARSAPSSPAEPAAAPCRRVADATPAAGDRTPQRPVNSGARLARKASTASRWSAVLPAARPAAAPRAPGCPPASRSPPSPAPSSPPGRPRSDRSPAARPAPAPRRAPARPATTRCTSPHCSAVSAVKGSGVSSSWAAREPPTQCTSRARQRRVAGQPDPGERGGELGPGRGDPQVAGQREAQTGARRRRR